MEKSISIIHASRSRGSLASKTANNWISRADNKTNIEYIISLDLSDPKGLDYREYFSSKQFIKCIKNNKSAIEAFNQGAKISTGNILVCTSDDFDCPEHWDTLLLEAIGDKTDICIKTQDGIQKTMLTLPILDRTYYNRFGYVYDPKFKHLFADTQMTVVAMMLDRYLETNIYIPHNHYTIGKSKKDAINKKNDATWDQGKKVFYEGLKNNFGIKNPKIKFKDIVW